MSCNSPHAHTLSYPCIIPPKFFLKPLPTFSTPPQCLETFRGILAKSGIDPSLVQEVAVGNCRESSSLGSQCSFKAPLTSTASSLLLHLSGNVDNAYDIRAAALAAGLPNTSPTLVVNRFCSSGLMAVREVANQIQAGEIDCGELMKLRKDVNPPSSFELLFTGLTLSSSLIRPCCWSRTHVKSPKP